jgi:hypothetical protein
MRRVRRGTPTFRGELVERCRSTRQLFENADLAGDKKMLCRHEAHRDPHDRIGCDLSHYASLLM